MFSKKFWQSPWVITIGGTIVASIGIDSITNIPLLTSIFKLLTINIELWVILILLSIYIIVKKYAKLDMTKETRLINSLKNHRNDKIDGYNYLFKLVHRYDDNVDVEQLSISCPECQTPMTLVNSYSNLTARCPRCSNEIYNLKSLEDTKKIIIDNLNRKNNHK